MNGETIKKDGVGLMYVLIPGAIALAAKITIVAILTATI